MKYELLGTRKTSEQKYYHVESLRALGRVYDVGTLLGNLGWLDYVEMKCKSHNQRVIELLSYWAGSYRGQEVLISFRMFNTDHWMSLRGFNELFHLLMNTDALRDVLSLRIPGPIWLSITCFKHKTYTDRFGRPRIYDPRKTKPWTFVT